jgi:hypothetical protein
MADPATNKTLFDFQAATTSPACEVVNDGVMGGVSTSQFQLLTNGCAVFGGTVRLENNGGFASVRCAPSRSDLTGCHSFLLRLRDVGRRCKFSVRTEAGLEPLYQLAFTTKRREWGRTSATLQGFRADLSRSLPNRRAAAESGESQLGWISDFRQGGRPFPAGNRLDQSPTATAMNLFYR